MRKKRRKSKRYERSQGNESKVERVRNLSENVVLRVERYSIRGKCDINEEMRGAIRVTKGMNKRIE